MVLKIRLARFGKTNKPFYNIVVAHARYLYFPPYPPPTLTHNPPFPPNFISTLPKTTTNAPPRTARNSKPLEVLGTYDPVPKLPPFGDGKPTKDIKLDTARAKYWLGVGVQPSEPAWRLLSMVSLGVFILVWMGGVVNRRWEETWELGAGG